MEDGLSLVCLLFHDCVNILLISLDDNHQLPLFFDQVFLDPLDLRVELILLKGETLLDFFIFLLIHRVIDCTLEFAKESIVFSFLFCFALMDQNLRSELLDRNRILLNQCILGFKSLSAFLVRFFKYLYSFIDICLYVKPCALGHQQTCLMLRWLMLPNRRPERRRFLSSVEPYRLLAIRAITSISPPSSPPTATIFRSGS